MTPSTSRPIQSDSARHSAARAHRRARSRAAAVVVACGLAVSLAQAQSSSYTGGASDPNNWCLGSNWDPSGIPGDGFTIQIGEGFNVDLFQCPSGPPRLLGVITAESPVRFWGPVNFSAGGSLTTPNFSFSTTPNPIGGELVVTGFGSLWHGGIFTGGTLRNTGHLLVRRTTFGGRAFPRAIRDGANLHNDNSIDANVGFDIDSGSRLINNVSLTFTGSGVTVGGIGIIENPGQLFVDPGASATISPGFISTGRIASAGVLTLGNNFQDVRGQVDLVAGGSIALRPFSSDALYQVGPLTLAGQGSFIFDGANPALIGQITSSIEAGAAGRGLWFSTPGDITIEGRVQVASGLATWSAGHISGNDPLRPLPHIVIEQGAVFAIQATPSESGGYLYSARLDVNGIARQKRTLQLAQGSLAVVQGTTAAWELDNALLFSDGTGSLTLGGGATLAVNQSETSSLARIDGMGVRLSGNSFLDVIRGTLNTENNTPGNPPMVFADQAYADIAGSASWNMFGRTIVEGSDVQFSGSGIAEVESGAQLQIADGGTLTVNMDDPGTFRLSGTLGAGPDDPDVSGFNASFENNGRWTFAGGEISLPRGDFGTSVFNLGSLDVTCSGCALRTDLQNDGTMTVTRTLSLRAPGVELINNGPLLLVGGRIGSSSEGPGAVLMNSTTGSISQVGTESAFIDVTLSNHGSVHVLSATLFCNGAIVQISNNTLTDGYWNIQPEGTLRTPNRTVGTIGAGATLILEGSWPEFQPAVNQGDLRLGGLRSIPRALANSGIVNLDIGSTLNLTGAGSNYTQSQGQTVLGAGATLNAGSNILRFDGGFLSGIGTVIGLALDNLGATLSPGMSPGVLTVQGNCVQGPQGTLAIEVAGTAGAGDPAGHDQLAVSAAATLGGTLRVTLLDGFVPARGDTFTILTASSITGSFDSIVPPPGLDPALDMSIVMGSQSVAVRFGCRADFNSDGQRDPDDLSDFITCFFLDVQFPGICAESDFNADGFRDPDDLSDFITSFFLGC